MATKTETIKLLIQGIGDFSDVEKDVGGLRKVLGELKLSDNLKRSFKNTFSELENETKNYQQLLNSGFKTKKDITGLEASGKKIDQLMDKLVKDLAKIGKNDLAKTLDFNTGPLADAKKKVEELREAYKKAVDDNEDYQKATNALLSSMKELSQLSKAGVVKDLKIAIDSGDLDAAEAGIKKVEDYLVNGYKGSKKNQIQIQLEAIKHSIGTLKTSNVEQLRSELSKADNVLSNLTDEQLQTLISAFGKLNGVVEDAAENLEKTHKNELLSAESTRTLNRELDNIKNGIVNFFSLSNAANMFKSAVRNAFNTVQELDKIMTETAVVTDFSVGDMWDQLPQYTKMANELGVAIADVYSASTLYYQQGLQTKEVMDITTETLKMARIASIDSAEATNYMTAALRGFNMEIDETNARRINNVYSELAAITAADTGQIATAVTKTSSIASAANMEFETTAAFLSQIIETTQEAPETAGTALKTIIARFSEVKKLREQGVAEGTDEEGEFIDVNKIQSALKTVGISMEGFFAGTEGLDNVLIKLAEKWKTLDFETQRYIATTAAGSRQQSRFIAMMSDYERTMQLVGAANNSAGASQRQFNKTTESLESKLNRLKNATDEFLMGIANSDIIKGAVDLLTDLITGLNGFINITSGENGAVKSAVSLSTAIFGLWGGSKLANSGIGLLASTLLKGMPVAKQFRKEGEKTTGFLKELTSEFTDLPGIFSMMGTGFKEAKAGMTGINGIVKGLGGSISAAFTTAPVLSWAATIGAAYGALKLFNWVYGTWFNQEKIMQRRLEQSQKAAEMLTTEYQNLKNALTSIDAKDAELDELAIGTEEWTEKVKELNQELLTLIETYPELREFLRRDANGKLYLDEGSEEVVQQKQLNSERAKESVFTSQYNVDKAAVDKFISDYSGLGFGSGNLEGNSLVLAEENRDAFYREVADIDPSEDIGKQIRELIKKYTDYTDEQLANADPQRLYNLGIEYLEKLNKMEISKESAATASGLSEKQFEEQNSLGIEYVKNYIGTNQELVTELIGEGYKVDDAWWNWGKIYVRNGEEELEFNSQEDFDAWTANMAGEKNYVDYDKGALESFNNGQYGKMSLIQQDETRNALNRISALSDEGLINYINYEEFAELLNLIEKGGNIEEFINNLKAVQKEGRTIEENAEEISKITEKWGEEGKKAASELAKEWKKDQDAIKDVGKLLDDNTLDSEKIEIFKNAFGFNGSDDKALKLIEDYKEELALIEEGGEGAAAAFERIQIAVGNDFINSLGLAKEESEQLHIILSSIDGMNIEVGGTADFSDIFQQLFDLGIATEKAAALIEGLGYTVTPVQNKNAGMVFRAIDKNGNWYEQVMPEFSYIVSKKGVDTGRGNTGRGNTSGGNTGGGNTGSGSSKNKNWENPYDKFYNTTEKINEELRIREKLENRYDRLLKSRKSTTQELNKLYLNQIASLRKENDLQQQIANGRKSQIQNLKSEKFADDEGNEKSFSSWGVTKYASYDFATNTIKINWGEINKVKDEELGSAIEEYISRLEEYAESYEEALDTIEDNIDEIRELQTQYISDYLELEQRVYDAIVEERQRQIDELSSLSDTLSEANEKIISSLQESIDLERQIRDNTKTEEEINDMEARLAYLRRDTSGGNAIEIAQLEEELANARESYNDTLVDQEIERLSKQNEEAAGQRERQIEIMQAQLDYDAENGAFWKQTYELINEAVTSKDINNTGMAELLRESEAFKGMSRFGQNQWMLDLVEIWNKSEQGLNQAWLQEAKDRGYIKQGSQKYTYDEKTNSWKDSKGNVYDASYNSETGKFNFVLTKAAPTASIQPTDSSAGSSASYYKKADRKYNGYFVAGLNSIGVDSSYNNRAKIAAVNGYKNYSGTPAQNQELSKRLVEGTLKKYATGGIADFTGPAWLDGTKSKPELVLNARDTQNFIALKDILSSLLGRDGDKVQSSGDNYFDIHINVDELGSDYDVDQLVTRIKQKIYEDSSYRNVNAINFIR